MDRDNGSETEDEGLREAGPLFVRPSPLCTVV
jgi:hypothetical protein